jgi:NAD(P)-dependent dehydrogenase (short-subunit alcohol dehydrogenase family)
VLDRPPSPRSTALLTGCSSGFGLLTAVELARRGFRVYATMRDLGKRESLDAAAQAAGVHLFVLPLDVTHAESVASAVEAVMADSGRIDLVVSNAGYGLGGNVEDLTLAELREQFETNFFGAVMVTKAVLPTMRECRAGRLIFVSSLNGLLGFPGLAAYCASKFALEGFAESLRWEVLLDGIYVSLIEPGSFPTPIFGRNRRIAAAAANPASPYYARSLRLEALVLRRIAGSKRDPRTVARAIARVATSSRPRLRYRIGADAHLAVLARWLLPDRVLDKAMRRLQE